MSAFSKINGKSTKAANSEAHFSKAHSERVWEQFWIDFGSSFGGLGDVKLETMRSKSNVKKKSILGRVWERPNLPQGSG